MLAMPIADNSAPIVVGISVTNSATSITTEIGRRHRPRSLDHHGRETQR
jgi:hypothetical protein